MADTVPGSCNSTVHEHTEILQSGDKLRHRSKGSCIPRKKNMFSCVMIVYLATPRTRWTAVMKVFSLPRLFSLSDKMWSHGKTLHFFRLWLRWSTTTFPFISSNLKQRKPQSVSSNRKPKLCLHPPEDIFKLSKVPKINHQFQPLPLTAV